MRLLRFVAITVLLLACVVLGTACAGAKGEQGIQGPKGETGAAGVGVENIVNNGDGTFTVSLTNGTAYTTDNLTGPKGEQGEQGLQGVQGNPAMPGTGVEWVGQWDSATLYTKYDAVGYQGSSYISKQNNNTNHMPTDTNWWDLWVEKGDQGLQGIQGVPGPNMIVAMGFVGSLGTLFGSYNVNDVRWDSNNHYYEITLGVWYDPFVHVTLVTGFAIVNVNAVYDGSDGKLRVKLFNPLGEVGQFNFSFMVLTTDVI